MAFKDTIAIIGANSTIGRKVAEGMATHYRLLLIDTTGDMPLSPLNELLNASHVADIEVLNCCKNACWEADAIVVASQFKLEDIAVKMKEVATRKTVIHFTDLDGDTDTLQNLLPFAKVVTVLLEPSFFTSNVNRHAFVYGNDAEAIEAAGKIITAIGCVAEVTLPEQV